jgi:hypothetical protein
MSPNVASNLSRELSESWEGGWWHMIQRFLVALHNGLDLIENPLHAMIADDV